MHIAIDARMYGTKQRGIGRYLINLIKNLEVVDKQNRYTLFLRKENFNECNTDFIKKIWDAPWYGIKEQIDFKKIIKDDIDLYHFPHFNIPYFFPKPFIMTLHDLELFSTDRSRSSSTKGKLTYSLKVKGFKTILNNAINKSKAIIVPSNTVRNQVIHRWSNIKQKVHTVYEAPTLKAPRVDIKPVEGKYILYVGAAYPHKNLDRLLNVWKTLKNELKEYQLVLVGRQDFFWEKLEKGNAVFYGEANDEELAALYKNASLLVQPSLEEGFSLPPLEALSFGCPVAASNIPTHNEILQDSALFFDPKDEASIARIIKNMLTDNSFKNHTLSQAKTLLERYSWSENAQQTKGLYETIKIV